MSKEDNIEFILLGFSIKRLEMNSPIELNCSDRSIRIEKSRFLFLSQSSYLLASSFSNFEYNNWANSYMGYLLTLILLNEEALQ